MNPKLNSSPFSTLNFAGSHADDNRKLVNSFDVFDTLICRRCIEPIKIFEQVGAKFNIPNFTSHRRQAESAVAKNSYNIHDIYRQLALDINLTEIEADEIKAYEIAAEIESVVPITENMAKVIDGDLLVSDMYLSQAIIQELLTKAGLKKNIELVVTSHGKHSGELWPKLLKNYSIQRHLGDNRHGDIAMPEKFGINSVHTSLAAPTPIELWLIEKGLRDLALLIREARVATWHPDPVMRRLQLVQICFNFPILLFASIGLFNRASKLGISRLLFASRDCNMWLPLAQIIAKQMNVTVEMEYFYTSRKARIQPSPDYITYASARLNERSMLVDICGSGWSGARLMQFLGLKGGHVFYIHNMKPLAVYEQKYPTPNNCTIHYIIGPAKTNLSNPRFEMCNYAEHASVIDVRLAEKGDAVPVFDIDERPDIVKSYIKEQRSSFGYIVGLLERIPLNKTLSLNDDAIEQLIGTFYSSLSKDDILNSAYNQSHRHEDAKAMRDMGLIE